MKQRVVYLFYHGLGHINAFSKVAKILEDANYEVYFAGVGYFHRYLTTQNLRSYPLRTNPFGLGLETWINTIEKKKYIYLSALRDRINDRVYDEREVELYWMLEDLKPNIVLIDALQATDFIVMYQHLKKQNIKVAMVQTTLPLDLASGLPPLNSDVFPDDKIAVKKSIRILRWAQFKKKFVKKIVHWGFDDPFVINRRIRKNGIPQHYISKIPSLLNFSVTNLDQLVIAPKEFDFPGSSPVSMHHYIGFMTNEKRNEQAESNFENVSPTIFRLKKERNLKLVYCSFGTIEPKDKRLFFSFFQKMIQAIVDANHLAIISLKAKDEDIAEFRTSDQIYIFNFVPQLEVLKHADLFITHGGLNSIKESVHAEVPMLLYPIHPEYDPTGNTARIAYHGLGLRGTASTDTSDNIKEKINELLSKPSYKNKVRELKECDLHYTRETFLKIFAAIQHLSI